MLHALHLLVTAAAVTGPAIEVSTLDGKRADGELVSLSATELVVETDAGEQTLPVDGLLEVRFPEADGPTGVDREKHRVTLVDGTELDCEQVTVGDRGASLQTVRVGTVSVPAAAVAHVRFGEAEQKFDETWTALATEPTKSDLLVVRKPEVLDHLKGVVGAIDEKAVRFLLGGNEVPVDRQKVYGVVYGDRTATPPESGCEIALTGADGVTVKSLVWDGNAFTAALAAGGAGITIPTDRVRLLDFSLGKIAYLSRIEPESVDYTPYWPDDDLFWVKYRRDMNQIGQPLKIAGQRFDRGLWVHSGTTLEYRLAGEYRTFEAVMGMEEDVRSKGSTFRLIVKGDDEVLFEQDVTGLDDPRKLSLDVGGKNFLEIVVEFGKDGDYTCDHLALGEARLLK